MQEQVKKHQNKNKYYLATENIWVRDFQGAVPEDINDLIAVSDYKVFLDNERKNAALNIASIDAETIFAPNVIIVSDGYNFEEKQHLLKNFPQDQVTIIGTNRSLAKWARHTRMDWFLANNPYKECMLCLPSHSYCPRCIVSNRTYTDFIRRYRARTGVIYRYTPTPIKRFASNYFQAPLYHVDDYRNPICAALSIAFRWEAQKILLFCCDDAFQGERTGSINISDDLWMYPQHGVVHKIIDAMAYWMVNKEYSKVKIGNYSASPTYRYIQKVDDLLSFF